MNILLCTGIALLAGLGTGAAPSRTGGELVLTPESLDLGKVRKGEILRRTVKLENRGEGSVAVTRVGANCGCATVRLSAPGRFNVPIDRKNEGLVDLDLAPATIATMTLVFDTSSLGAGRLEKQVMVIADDQATPHVLKFAMDIEEPPPPPELVKARSDGPKGALEADRQVVDFGEVLRGESPRATYELRNQGEGPLVIERIRPGCTCTAAHLTIGDEVLDEETIAERSLLGRVAELEPGGTATLEVVMNTGEVPITVNDQVVRKSTSIYSNDPLRRVFNLTVEAKVMPAFELDPTVLRFPPVQKGRSMQMTTRLVSERLDGYALKGVTLLGREDLVEVSFQLVEEGTRPVYELLAVLKDTAPIGRFNERLELTIDHPKVQILQVPIMGEVTPAVVFRGNVPGGAERANFGVLDGTEDGVVEIHIENLDPSLPYVPQKIELTSRLDLSLFSHELEEVQEGVSYVLRLRASKDIQDRYFNGRVRITSQHPDVPIKLVDFRGWMDRSGKKGDGS